MDRFEPIDFVVTWVDDTDIVWRRKKAEYTQGEFTEGNKENRYRNWENLIYWFRGVEKFAPWVRYVFFVTDDQKPEWLNLEHPKLKWVKHTDFIPEEYLPTFNSNVIEWNLHRIEELSENFVYFNDDVFLINKTKPTDFFVNGLPCDLPNISVLYPFGFFSYVLFNNIDLLNRHFSLKESIRKDPLKWIKHQSFVGLIKNICYGRRGLIPNSVTHHIHTKLNKKTFEILWEKEYQLIHETCKNKLRSKKDVTVYCVRDWLLFSNDFYPQKPIGKFYHTKKMEYSNKVINYLKKQKGKVICLNDTEDEMNFEEHKAQIIEVFEKILPEKSSFEL